MNIGLYDILREDDRIHWLSGQRAELGIGHPSVHKGLVLLFVIGVADEETATGELGDLFVDQAFFVEAITEAFLGGR